MQRCFCCNARLKDQTTCPRCQADLSLVIASENSAKYWLGKAIQSWTNGELELCLEALAVSLELKKTKLAINFRDYLIQQQCRQILVLLTERKLLQVKKKLYQLRKLVPESMQLQQLHSFTDYLWVHN